MKDNDDQNGQVTLKVRADLGGVQDRGRAQQKFGTVKLAGVDASRRPRLQGMLQAQPGQPFSLITLSGDRDAILGYYLSNGFDRRRWRCSRTSRSADKTKTDVTLQRDRRAAGVHRQGAGERHSLHAAERGERPGEGARGIRWTRARCWRRNGTCTTWRCSTR